MSLKRRRRQAARMRELRQAVQPTQETNMSDGLNDALPNTEVVAQSHEKKGKLSPRQSIIDKLSGGKALTRKELFQAVCEDADCTYDAVRNALNRLLKSLDVTEVDGKYRMVPSSNLEASAFSERTF